MVNSLLVLSFLSSIGCGVAYSWFWLKKRDTNSQFITYLSFMPPLLLFFGLSWQSIERQHLLPLSLDQLLLCISLFIWVSFIIINRKSQDNLQGILSIGLLLSNILWGWGLINTFLSSTYTGLEALWWLALLARWLIVIGLGCFYWLTIFIISHWISLRWGDIPPLDTFKDTLQKLSLIQNRLLQCAISTLLSGIILITIQQWLTGNLESVHRLFILGLLLSAVNWLHHSVSPHRVVLEDIFMVLTFVVGLGLVGGVGV